MPYVKPQPPPKPQYTTARAWEGACKEAAFGDGAFAWKDPAYISVETGRTPRISLMHKPVHDAIGRPTLLNWNRHGTKLEEHFPGCQVAYDRHPTLRTWERPYLTVSFNWTGMPPRQRGVDIDQLGHRRHRARLHEAMFHAQRMGPLILVCYELAPPVWKPHMIVTLSTRSDRVMGIQDMHAIPVHAIYHPNANDAADLSDMEGRWVLIR